MAVVRVTQAYRFALEPTPAQERAVRSHAARYETIVTADGSVTDLFAGGRR
jgi:hypothetical protein